MKTVHAKSILPPPAEVQKRVRCALEELRTRDQELFQTRAHERSLTFRLALYLQRLFEDWVVDCEYNRDGRVPKVLAIRSKTGRVFPDIIVHRRGKSGPNLLVIEAKTNKNTRNSDQDFHKLYAYQEEFRYENIAFVRFKIGLDTPGYDVGFDIPKKVKFRLGLPCEDPLCKVPSE